jgi:hypothetical protein
MIRNRFLGVWSKLLRDHDSGEHTAPFLRVHLTETAPRDLSPKSSVLCRVGTCCAWVCPIAAQADAASSAADT